MYGNHFIAFANQLSGPRVIDNRMHYNLTIRFKVLSIHKINTEFPKFDWFRSTWFSLQGR